MDPFAEPGRVSCAYDAEATLAFVLGSLLRIGFRGDRYRGSCLDICDLLAADGSRQATGILRTFAVTGLDAEVREYAETLAARGPDAPGWADELGQAIPGKCWLATDEFGESVICLAEFRYPTPGNRHAMLTRVDPLWNGAVTSLTAPYVTEDSRDVSHHLDGAAKLGVNIREIPPAEAAGILQRAVDAFIRHGPAPWMETGSEDFKDTVGLLAVLSQRARALAAIAEETADEPVPEDDSADPSVVADRWPEEERDRLVAEFHDSPEGKALDGAVATFLPLDIVDSTIEILGRDPLHPGPLVFTRLLKNIIPSYLIIPARLSGQVTPVVAAWATWITSRAGLPEKLRKRVLSTVKDAASGFTAAHAAAARQQSNRYFQDLPDDIIVDPVRCERTLRLRHLAVPLHHNRPAGTADADASTPTGRAEVTKAWLAEREIPRSQWPAYHAVIERLWAGAPAELAERALHMDGEHRSRDEILDDLAQP